MATVNLYPDGISLNSFSLSTGVDAPALLADDSTGAIGFDSNYLYDTVAGTLCFLTLDNFTEDHDSIDGVQIVLRAGNDARAVTYDIETKLMDSGLTTYYTESTGTETSHRNYKTHTFTNRTTYDGSNAWNNTLVNSLRLRVKLDAISGGTFKWTQAYVIVTYTEPLATDNSVFFGTNF